MKNKSYLNNPNAKLWINIASSTNVLDNFVNLDNHIFLSFAKVYPILKNIIPLKYSKAIESYYLAQQKYILIKHDCRKVLFFANETVDHILCSHFLEHIFPDEMKLILKDFYRVLKNDGTMHIIVPDLEYIIKNYLSNKELKKENAADEFIKETLLSRETKGTFKYRLMEFKGGFGLQHRWMYDKSSITRYLADAGFQILEINETPSKNFRLNDGSIHVICKKL